MDRDQGGSSSRIKHSARLENQGSKKVRLSKFGLVRLSMLLVIVAAFAVLYLVQSSQLVTSVRHLQQLQSELIQLQQDNAQLVLEISAAGSVTRLQSRAAQLGFGPADEVVYLQVKSQPVDDALTIESAFGH